MNEVLINISSSLSTLDQFHFLRPLWLLAIIPALLLAGYFWQQKSSAVNWYNAINKQLIEHLLEAGPKNTVRWPWVALLLAWIITAVAIAGPAWEKLPQPVHQKSDALVILLDLSLSMRAEDVQPSRLIRARHKTLDILSAREEGLTGLIAYSGDAHIVSPLTDDNATIANLLPALSPDMMPVNGSDPYAAVQLARQLFKNAGHQDGRILLITDGVTDDDLEDISDSISRSGFELSVLGVGTSQGAPIPMQSGFIRDDSGNIVIPKLPRDRLDNLAQINGGRYADVSLDDKDIDFLLPTTTLATLNEETVLSEREFDQWRDRGHWLALAILPIALLAFRRGWLLLLPVFILLEPQRSMAFEWQDLWQRADQQAAKTLAEGDAEAAAKQFKNKQWQGSAQYKANDFEAAAENFKQFDSADAHYNRGNALAKAGKLDDAIKAYDEALKRQPEMEDARFNKDLVEKLKQQQQQNSSDQNQDSEQSDNSDQQNQQGDQSGQGENSQQQDQQNDQNNPGDQNNQQSTEQQQNDPEQSKDSKNDGADLPEEQAEKQKQREAQQAQQNDKDKEEQAQSQPQADEQKEQDKPQQQAQELSQAEQENKQKQQAVEQWLRQIPDEPSGLLRRKFDYEYRLRQRDQRQQKQQRQREQPKW